MYRRDPKILELPDSCKNTDIHILFIGNPYCSDDALGYHIFMEIRDKTNHKIFFSYNIEIEDILLSLDNSGNASVLIIDTEIGIELRYIENAHLKHKNTHKAEWGILSSYCDKNDIPLSILLVPVSNVEYTGEIINLSPEMDLYRDMIVRMIN